jgi:hypothetical protein
MSTILATISSTILGSQTPDIAAKSQRFASKGPEDGGPPVILRRSLKRTTIQIVKNIVANFVNRIYHLAKSSK